MRQISALTGYKNNHSRNDEEEAQAYLEPRPPVAAAAAADDLGGSEDHHRGRPLSPHTPVRLHFVRSTVLFNH